MAKTLRFPLNAWYCAAWDVEFGHSLLARTLCNNKLVMYRTGAGSVVALEDACWHRLVPLSMGRLRGDDVVCAYHGLAFNAHGRGVFMPSQETINPSACVRSKLVRNIDPRVFANVAEMSMIPVTALHCRAGINPNGLAFIARATNCKCTAGSSIKRGVRAICAGLVGRRPLARQGRRQRGGRDNLAVVQLINCRQADCWTKHRQHRRRTHRRSAAPNPIH
jgi:nitrite reductase/ring-hydroxylating ferredoxin subunit